MALLDCHMYSHTLFSNISFYVSLPTPSSGDKVNYATLKRDFGYDEGLPVAYLLHGMFGDASSWIRYSSIDRYAQDCIRSLVWGSHTKGRFRLSYQAMKDMGYLNLVHEYYKIRQ